MKVNFDPTLLIAGIGLVPWTRLGPDIWFNQYKIASMSGWDIDDPSAPLVFSLRDKKSDAVLLKSNTQSLIEDSDFQKILTDNFTGYSLLTYKPVTPPQRLTDAGIRFLHGDIELARNLEDKAEFRRRFTPHGIKFPSYDIYEKENLRSDQDTLETILKNRQSVIFQDSVLSGGKGTFVVSDVDTLNAALSAVGSMPGEVVVSEKIEASFERTVQCVVTRYGTFVGPLQKQIVGNALLANLTAYASDKFCGAEISQEDICTQSYETIKSQALLIGQELFAQGYRGIFGMDCLVARNGEVYTLEINPRITGVTPLITMIQRDEQGIPFYLLHVLELMNAHYTIDDIDNVASVAEGSLLILHAQTQTPATVTSIPSSGVYDKDLVRLSGKTHFTGDENERYIVQRYHSVGSVIKPGDRLLSVVSNRRVLNDDDTLNDITRQRIEKLYATIRLENI